MTAPVPAPLPDTLPLPRVTISIGRGGSIQVRDTDGHQLSNHDLTDRQRQEIVSAVAARLGVVR